MKGAFGANDLEDDFSTDMSIGINLNFSLDDFPCEFNGVVLNAEPSLSLSIGFSWFALGSRNFVLLFPAKFKGKTGGKRDLPSFSF